MIISASDILSAMLGEPDAKFVVCPTCGKIYPKDSDCCPHCMPFPSIDTINLDPEDDEEDMIDEEEDY